MSRAEALERLAACFERAEALNLQILAALEAGASLASVKDLFDAKADLDTVFEQSSGNLEGLPAAEAESPALGRAQAAQARAARTEARLSEALGKLVPPSNKAARAYQQSLKTPQSQGWERSG